MKRSEFIKLLTAGVVGGIVAPQFIISESDINEHSDWSFDAYNDEHIKFHVFITESYGDSVMDMKTAIATGNYKGQRMVSYQKVSNLFLKNVSDVKQILNNEFLRSFTSLINKL